MTFDSNAMPIREPYPTEPTDPASDSGTTIAVKRQKINATFARQMDERVRVMLDRNLSLRTLFENVGVSQVGMVSAGVRGEYAAAYDLLMQIDELTQQMREKTISVRETFDSL